MSIRFSLMSGALTLAVGCAGDGSSLVAYDATGGLSGDGVGASLTVDRDGAAVLASHRDQSKTLSFDATVVADLQRKIADADFPQLRSEYLCSSCVDVYRHVITASAAGRYYTVTVDDGAGPEKLTPLIDTLRILTQDNQ